MNNIDLRKPEYSPLENPFLNKSKICIHNHTKTVTIYVGKQKLIDPKTSKIITVPMIHITEEIDEDQFTQVFANHIREIFNLSRTGYRIFTEVLKTYRSALLTDNHTDSITLAWLNDGLNGMKLDMTDRTFHNGLKELIIKDFLKPKLRNQYWINPAIFTFFKDNRSAAFVQKYQIQTPSTQSNFLDNDHQNNFDNFSEKPPK
ncbi:hypothetical protein [Bartonella sp. B41]